MTTETSSLVYRILEIAFHPDAIEPLEEPDPVVHATTLKCPQAPGPGRRTAGDGDRYGHRERGVLDRRRLHPTPDRATARRQTTPGPLHFVPNLNAGEQHDRSA